MLHLALDVGDSGRNNCSEIKVPCEPIHKQEDEGISHTPLQLSFQDGQAFQDLSFIFMF